MSLVRTALRLQAIEALLADPVIGAYVQGRVYDSRIADFDHREPVPTILVTTEETKGDAWDRQNGGGAFKLDCDLVLEIAMNALGEVGGAEGDPFEVIGYAATDRELEAVLDLLEDRAIHALTVGETPAAILLREIVVRKVTSVTSSRFSTDQTGEKFAVHLVSLRVELLAHEADDPREPPTGDYALLPSPLREVAAASDPNGSARQTCDLLLARCAPLSGSAAPGRLVGVDMVLAPQTLDPATTPDKAADVAAGRVVALSVNSPTT